jgi:hypothetical protein
MANRFWVGGTNLNWTSFGNWAATSGGPATAPVPTIADDVFFDSNSGSSVVQVAATGSFQTVSLNNLTCTGYTGTINLGGSGSANKLAVYGNLTNGTATTWTETGSNSFSIYLSGSLKTITSNGRLFSVGIFIEPAASYTLTDALIIENDFYVQGQFTTANYNVSVLGKASPLSLGYCFVYGTINLGSSTFTVNKFSVADPAAVVNAGTSTIAFPQNPTWEPSIDGQGRTFYNITVVVFNNGFASRGFQVESGFTCNNLTFSGPAAISYSGFRVQLSDNVVVNGTLTFAGLSVKERLFVTSSAIGTNRTFTANACTASYVDFSNITIAGAAAPISGTSIGDIKRNSGINFTAPKTVYFVYTGTGFTDWNAANVWATSSGGVGSDANYPLAQDTVIYDDNSSAVGITFSMTPTSGYAYLFVGNLSFATRTNSLTLLNATGLCSVSDVTFSSAVTATQVNIIFLNNSPITYTPFSTVGFNIVVDCFGSTVNLGGPLTVAAGISMLSGTLNIGSNTVTFTGTSVITSNSSSVSQLNTGTGILDFTGTGNFSGSLLEIANQNFSVGGSGTIRSSNGTTSTKVITVQPNTLFTATIDQAGPGPLRITNGGTYQNITNSYASTGATTVQLVGGQTYTFTLFNLSGSVGKLCTLTTQFTSRANLRRPTGIWYMGANSVDAGNNSGLVFAAGGGVDYLSISKINGINEQSGFLLFF